MVCTQVWIIKIGSIIMIKQNPSPEKPFIVERECPRGPYFLLPSHRIATLQFKAAFFEGQLDPLQFQNMDLKETVIQLLRSISANTDILRRLIPADNAALQLKIDMASFPEIALMIQEEWQVMRMRIEEGSLLREQFQRDIQVERSRYKEEHALRLRQKLQNQQLQSNLEGQISTLQRDLAKLRSANEALQREAERERKERYAREQSFAREMHFKEYGFQCRQDEYQRCITRLNKTIDALKFEYEESKASLKALYDKVSNDKLSEQAETFGLMLKLKEDEKFKVERELSEIREMHAEELQEKEQEASRLMGRIEMERKRIKELEDQIYVIKEQGKLERMEFKNMQTELHLIRQNILIAEGITAKRDATILQMGEHLKKTIQGYQQKIGEIIRTRDERNNILQSQNRRQALLIQDLYKELSQLKTRLQFIDRQWDQKMKDLEQKQKAKDAKMVEELVKWEKLLQEEKNRSASSLANKEKQIDKIKEYYQSRMAKQERQFQSKRQELIKEIVLERKKQTEKVQEECMKVRLELSAVRQGIKKAIQDESLRIQKQYRTKMAEQEAAFQLQRKKYMQQLELRDDQKKSLKEQADKMAKKLGESEDKIQKMRKNHIREIAKLQGKNAELILTWQAKMDRQLDEFQNVIMERQKELGKKEIQFYEQMENMQEKVVSRQKQMHHFKSNQQKVMKEFKESNGIFVLEEKFQRERQQIKADAIRRKMQLQASFDSKVRRLNDQFAREKQELVSYYKEKLRKSQIYMETQLTEIGAKLIQINIGKEVNEEEERKVMEGMKCQQKVVHLHQLIANIALYAQTQRSEMDALTARLRIIEAAVEVQVQQRKAQIESERTQALTSMQDRIAKATAEYTRKWEQKQQEYRQKERQQQSKWKKFSELLYEQFKFLSSTHEKEYSKLMIRYSQLQKMMESRPSRQQDLNKIRQLQGVKTKLQGDIASLNRKLQTANEIVQYLNLQLQNYKEMYDIFGPNGEVGNRTISFQLDAQKMEKYKHFIQKKAKEELKSKSPTKDSQSETQIGPFFEVHNRSDGKNILDLKRAYEAQQDNDSLILQSKQQSRHQRKFSHYSQKKKLKQKQALKTELSMNQVRGLDLFQKTSAFLKMASSPPVVDPFRETDNDFRNRHYRRRKMKRLSTTGPEQLS